MNTLSRKCATALLVAWLPVAVGQNPSTQKPPTKSPPSEQAQREEEQKKNDNAVDAIHNFSVERRAEAIASAKRATEELDQQMERLQAQVDTGWARMDRATRARSQRAMTGLRQHRTAVAEWYGGMQHSSAGAWTEVRTGFVKSYRDLAEALRKARMEFKNEPSPPAEHTPATGDSHPR